MLLLRMQLLPVQLNLRGQVVLKSYLINQIFNDKIENLISKLITSSFLSSSFIKLIKIYCKLFI
jgi:hypothetical protein